MTPAAEPKLIADWNSLRETFAGHFEAKVMEKLDRAYAFAEQHHAGQKRLSGDPYIVHCLETANILHELHSDPDAITAGLLHDCIEDTPATREEIAASFGDEIADLVDGVTKISTRLFRDSEEQKAENLRKIMLAMVRDIRVIVIKLADRLHNMRTLEFLPQEKRLRIARESLEIYAPLAHRLGMARMKNELEDLAFRHLYPDDYQALVSQVKHFEEARSQTIETAIGEINQLLGEVAIPAQVSGRMKHNYSVWNKMRHQEKGLDQIFDIMALRIIVPALKDCYAVLGIVHAHWKPMPGRFKDYIAMPKSNMYQSLHTTVIGPSGEPLEIQIRTQEMHKTAEEGIAAHWSYKEGKSGENYETKLSWFRQFLDWQQDLRDSREFMEALKIDLFEDEVFVFTPKGEVKSLRRGANPIDYAYLIHSRLGDTLVGAKVNGRMVPLKYELKNGDIVEVVTKPDAKPSRNWLEMVKTTKAKNRIRHYFRQLDREEMIKQGKAQLSAEFERCGTAFNDVTKERLLDAANKMNFKTVEEVLLQVGDGNISARTVAARMGLEPPAAQPSIAPPPRPRAGNEPEDGVRVHGMDGMVVRFAQCCHPIPGDPIVGFITQGRGVSIHRKNCSNLKYMMPEPGRTVNVSWEGLKGAEHTLQLFVLAQDRERLLADLLQVFYDNDAVVKGTEARTNKENLAEAVFTVMIKGKEHLQQVLRKLEQVKDVLKVSRRGTL